MIEHGAEHIVINVKPDYVGSTETSLFDTSVVSSNKLGDYNDLLAELCNLKQKNAQLQIKVDETRFKCESKDQCALVLAKELNTLEAGYARQREHNSQLLYRVLSLQGNIQVCCRIRPITAAELKKKNRKGKFLRPAVAQQSETEVICYNSKDKHSEYLKTFNFDKAWGPNEQQEQVFQDIEPLAASVVEGFNTCILAYGQSGSGKTFTMEGLPEEKQQGITPRMIKKVFQLIALKKQKLNLEAEESKEESKGEESSESQTFDSTIQVGILEIYNEQLRDLLNPRDLGKDADSASGKTRLNICRNEAGNITVQNLSRRTIHCPEEMLSLLEQAKEQRSKATTALNKDSSRSHMVIDVHVSSGTANQQNNAHLFLVDLAGSERMY